MVNGGKKYAVSRTPGDYLWFDANYIDGTDTIIFTEKDTMRLQSMLAGNIHGKPLGVRIAPMTSTGKKKNTIEFALLTRRKKIEKLVHVEELEYARLYCKAKGFPIPEKLSHRGIDYPANGFPSHVPAIEFETGDFQNKDISTTIRKLKNVTRKIRFVSSRIPKETREFIQKNYPDVELEEFVV